MYEILFIFNLLLGSVPFGQQPAAPEAKILKPSSSHVTTIPTFGAFLPAQCDGAGNLYFHLDRGNASYNQGVIMKVELDSETPTLYRLDSNLVNKTVFVSFYVTSLGKVWFLVQSDDGISVVGFDSDGSVRSNVLLSESRDVKPLSFAISEHGVAVVAGYYDSQASEQFRGRSVAALYDQTGRMRRDLTEGKVTGVDPVEITKTVADGGATVGPDGNFYFLRANEIVVISETGDVVRQLNFTRPQAHATVRQIAVSDGLLSIAFRKPGTERVMQAEYLVIDAATGNESGLYEPASELGNNSVCFSRRNGYEFFRVEQGYVKFVTAALR
jgi:hypothetical protein